jgi:hypothetical protein
MAHCQQTGFFGINPSKKQTQQSQFTQYNSRRSTIDLPLDSQPFRSNPILPQRQHVELYPTYRLRILIRIMLMGLAYVPRLRKQVNILPVHSWIM